MKKALSLILALVMCLSLWACGGSADILIPTSGGNTNNSTTQETEGEPMVLYDAEYGYPFVNQARFHELLEKVELTTENWLDYIGVCSYTTEDVEKDAFGEIISVTTTKNYVLGAKNNQHYHLRDFVIALKDKSTEELTIYANSTGSNAPSVKEDFQLDQYVCTRIKGTLFLIDVPEEAIKKAEGIGLYFTVRYSDLSYGPPMDCFIRGTDGYEVADYPYGLFSD